MSSYSRSLKTSPASQYRNCLYTTPEGRRPEIHYTSGAIESFDHIVIATHADTSLSLLGDPNESEKERLSPWKYQENTVILHRDTDFIPPNKLHWASWNFMRRWGDLHSAATAPVSVSYYMNRLQNQRQKTPYLVTLNPQKPIDPNSIINHATMSHPLYSFASLESQSKTALRKWPEKYLVLRQLFRLWISRRCGLFFSRTYTYARSHPFHWPIMDPRSHTLYRGSVFHQRLSPKKHTFSYPATFFHFNIKRLEVFPNKVSFLAIIKNDYSKYGIRITCEGMMT